MPRLPIVLSAIDGVRNSSSGGRLAIAMSRSIVPLRIHAVVSTIVLAVLEAPTSLSRSTCLLPTHAQSSGSSPQHSLSHQSVCVLPARSHFVIAVARNVVVHSSRDTSKFRDALGDSEMAVVAGQAVAGREDRKISSVSGFPSSLSLLRDLFDQPSADGHISLIPRSSSCALLWPVLFINSCRASISP